MPNVTPLQRPAPDGRPAEDQAEVRRADRADEVRPAAAPEALRESKAPVAPVAPAALRAAPSRRRWLRPTLFALLPLVLVAGAAWYVLGGSIMSTDDAYVDNQKVGVSTDVSGIVKDVDVSDNQHVAAGEVLYRLDPRQFEIALDNAKANLAQTALTIDAMKADYKRMLQDIKAQQSQVDLDQTTYDRDAALLKSAATSQAIFDQANYKLQTDKAKLASLAQQAQVQLARLGGNPDIATDRHPQYLQAKAQVDEAQRQLDHTTVKAPFAGIVTNVPSIAPGKYLAAATTAFYLIDTEEVWVEANPKETELTYVQVGQPVTITVDTYPGVAWHGTVQSVSPAAAQEFSLLPAQNTSGNWVKVVQRVPMRIRVDTSDKSLPTLRAGMSVEAAVDTGHPRGLPHWF
ncbi:MAG TPA: HlyD family secretion protein [Xanthobacteraceae bacterium]|jgi:membrane fusion protein, multidrug efflux system